PWAPSVSTREHPSGPFTGAGSGACRLRCPVRPPGRGTRRDARTRAEDSEPQLSDDDDKDSVASDSSRKANPGGSKKPPGRRGLCKGKQPADTDTEDDEGSRSRSKKASAKKREQQRKGGCLSGGGKSKGPPALNYEQWRKWLAQSDLLPPEWAEALDVTVATVESSAMELRTEEVRTDPLDSAPLDSCSEGGDDSPTPRVRGATPPTDKAPAHGPGLAVTAPRDAAPRSLAPRPGASGFPFPELLAL
ncbi:unnamed protein product, partial [Prorocentrum cordatum]